MSVRFQNCMLITSLGHPRSHVPAESGLKASDPLQRACRTLVDTIDQGGDMRVKRIALAAVTAAGAMAFVSTNPVGASAPTDAPSKAATAAVGRPVDIGPNPATFRNPRPNPWFPLQPGTV